MGASFRAREAGAAIFAAADRATGLPLTEVVESGPLEKLTDTRYAQPAVVATSLAAWQALQAALRLRSAAVPAFCAGHSVGELAALVAADCLDVEAALRLVAARSQLMAAACAKTDGTMAAVVGLPEDTLRALCAEAAVAVGESVELANLNAPGQIVVSGHRRAVEWLQVEGRARGARRVLALTVGGPFHSVYMRPAAKRFAHELGEVPLRPAEIPVVLNQTAVATTDPEAIRAELAGQIAAPVRWAESLSYMASAGCTLFVEVGPGQVLSGLVRRSLPEARVANVADDTSLEAAIEAIQETGG